MPKFKKPVANLLRQNCYLLDGEPARDLKSRTEQKFYETIDETTDLENTSLVHSKTVVPYEITPEYVDSFRESADYHRDPAGAVLNASKRQGLGDIRDFQKVADMDDTQAQALYAQLQARFAAAQVKAPVPDPANVSDPVPNE